MTQDDYTQRLAQEGFAPAVTVARDGSYALGVHDHPFEAFAYVLEGDITLEVAGRATTYRPGETFRLPAGTPHKEWAGPHGVRYLSGRKEVS